MYHYFWLVNAYARISYSYFPKKHCSGMTHVIGTCQPVQLPVHPSHWYFYCIEVCLRTVYSFNHNAQCQWRPCHIIFCQYFEGLIWCQFFRTLLCDQTYLFSIDYCPLVGRWVYLATQKSLAIYYDVQLSGMRAVRRIPHHGRSVANPRTRRAANMQYQTPGSTLMVLSPGDRDREAMDPIAGMK